MIRGTTVPVKLKFPEEINDIEKIRVYFMQGSETIVTKEEDDCTIEGNIVTTELSQEETYDLTSKKRLQVTCRFMTSDGSVGGSKPVYFDVYDSGGEEEILVRTTE